MRCEIQVSDGVRLQCELSGAGRPLVLVHGWACNRSFWSASALSLSRNYRILTPDLAGHGESAGTGRRDDWSISVFAEDVREIIETLELRHPILIGHSMGGAVALEVARRLGDRAGGVVMVDTFLFDYGYLPPARVRELMIPFRRNLAKAIARMVGDMSSMGRDGAWGRPVIAQMAATAPEVALAALESLFMWDPVPAFTATHVPIYWVSGDRVDSAARERHAAFVQREILLDAAHFLMQDAPEELAGSLRELLAALPEPFDP